MSSVLISLGANMPGAWGVPLETLRQAISELRRLSLTVDNVSALYETEPVGGLSQPRYLNAVIVAKASISPATLLRRLKQVERRAGRRRGGKVGPATAGPRHYWFRGDKIRLAPGPAAARTSRSAASGSPS